MRFLVFLFSFFLLYGCKSTTKKSEEIRLKFLDEYVLPNNLMTDSTLVGGLSGIDYYNNVYYIACDDDKNPRYYKTQINISDYKIDSVNITNTVFLNKIEKRLDLESIVIDTLTNDILLVSEGGINDGKDPSFIRVYNGGKLLSEFEIPQYFKAKGKQRPRNNGVFEGLTKSFDNRGYWVATELPLKEDGPKPKITETTSPVRVTYFDTNEKATKQFAYLLDKIDNKPLEDFAVNGVTDLLAYAERKLLIIERSYSSGYGNQGNVIKIYSVDVSSFMNTLNVSKLQDYEYKPIEKELVFNFESIKQQLTNQSIDNVEGVCFGPMLPNGNQSLIFITDNDFNKQGNRQTQLILMEIIPNKTLNN